MNRRIAPIATRLVFAAFLLAVTNCQVAADKPTSSPTPVDPEVEANAETEASAEPTAWSLPEPDLGYNARQGRQLFAHYCATCHGAEGRGDGFNAYSLDPKPRDLGDPAFQARTSDADLAAVIRSGGAAAGLSSAMPPWGRTLNEREIRNLAVFLRTLPAEPEDTTPSL